MSHQSRSTAAGCRILVAVLLTALLLPGRLALSAGPEPLPSLSSSSCAGPSSGPYLYISFHGGTGASDVNNILRYSIGSACLDGFVFADADVSQHALRSLRGMKHLATNYTAASDILVFSNAYKDDSRLVLASPCAAATSAHPRSIQATFISQNSTSNPSMVHSYGLAVVDDGYGTNVSALFASNQDTNSITWYSVKSKSALSAFCSQCGRGEFALLDQSQQGIRGIAYAANFPAGPAIIAADSVGNQVVAFPLNGGSTKALLSVTHPIGLLYAPESGLLFIGSDDGSDSSVLAWNVSTGKVAQKYSSPAHLSHPAGLALHNGTLYVLSQDTLELVAFDLASGAFLGVLASKLPDVPEDLVLSEFC